MLERRRERTEDHVPLTDASIKAMRPTPNRTRKSDGGGLFIDVAPNGSKVFRLAYRFAGQQRTLVVGAFPETKLAIARQTRETAKALLRDGQDPAAVFTPEKPAVAPLPDPDDEWENLVEAYMEKRRREGAAARTMKKMRENARATYRTLAGKHIADLGAQDVIAACRPSEAAGKLHTAHAIRTLCSQVFRYAIALGKAKYDPAAPARDAIARPVAKGYAAVTDPEKVGQLMRAIRAYDGEPWVRAGLLLSAYLFPRSGEIRAMRWADIDRQGAIWTVPKETMKMKRDHLVPLSRQAIAVLDWLHPMTGDCELVLHSPLSRGGRLSENTFSAALRSLGYSGDVHVHHGFRQTASTNLNEQGWNHDWIERQLAHVEGNKVRGAYNKALYLPGRTEMMQAYADWLDEQAARDQ